MSKTKSHQKYFKKSGEQAPGATIVINSSLGWNKNTLIAWTRREATEGRDPNKVRDQAADIGTIAHKMIEAYIDEVDYDPLQEYGREDVDRAENAYLAFLDWEGKNQPTYVESEFQFASELGFGGTIDCIAEIRNEFWLVDFKTSSGIYPEHKIQVAAYFHGYMGLEDQVLHDIKQVHILHIDKKNGSFSDHQISESELEVGWEVFKHCLEIYKLRKEIT